MTSLKFSNLIYGYPKHFEVEVRDFELKNTSVLCLTGNNGSGKSTLLKTLASSLPIIQGEILIHGKSLSAYSKSERLSLLAFLDFKINIPPLLRVITYLENSFYLQTGLLSLLNEKQKETLETFVSHLNLQDLLKLPLNHLSDGQRQRVFLCGALVKNPSFLLLDEPSLYLDIEQKENLIRLLKNLNKTIILSSHDFDFTQELGSQYLIIKNKKADFKGSLSKEELISFLRKTSAQ